MIMYRVLFHFFCILLLTGTVEKLTIIFREINILLDFQDDDIKMIFVLSKEVPISTPSSICLILLLSTQIHLTSIKTIQPFFIFIYTAIIRLQSYHIIQDISPALNNM